MGPYMPVAFVFSIATLYGSGADTAFWALILNLLAAPSRAFLVEWGLADSEARQP